MLQGGRRALWFQRALLLAMIPVVVVFTASLVQVPALYLLLTGFILWACFMNEVYVAPPVFASPVTHELTNELSWVQSLVERLALKANIPVPDVCVTHEADYNAAAKYYFNRPGTIFVHDALLYLLRFNAIPKEHIELSMAHEIGHLANHDQLGITLYKVFYALYQIAMLLSLGCCLGHAAMGLLKFNLGVLVASPVMMFIGSLVGYLYFGFGERMMSRNCEQLADDFSVRLAEIPPRVGVHRFAQIREWDYCVNCMVNPSRVICDQYDRWINEADHNIRNKINENPLLGKIHHLKLAPACAYYLNRGRHKTPYKKQIFKWLKEAAVPIPLSLTPTIDLKAVEPETTSLVDYISSSVYWYWSSSHPTDEQRRQYMLEMESDLPAGRRYRS